MKRVAWLVCWLAGDVRVAFNSEREAKKWCCDAQLATAEVIRVTYQWPPARRARRRKP